jgi:hypothetical protein
MPRHSPFSVGTWVDGLVTRRYQFSEQTLYQQRDEFAKTMAVLSLEGTPVARNRGAAKRANQVLVLAVLFYRRRTESLRECPALVGNGGAFKICTRSARHPRAR